MRKIVIFVIIVVMIGEADAREHREADYSTDSDSVKDKSNVSRYAAARSAASGAAFRAIQ